MVKRFFDFFSVVSTPFQYKQTIKCLLFIYFIIFDSFGNNSSWKHFLNIFKLKKKKSSNLIHSFESLCILCSNLNPQYITNFVTILSKIAYYRTLGLSRIPFPTNRKSCVYQLTLSWHLCRYRSLGHVIVRNVLDILDQYAVRGIHVWLHGIHRWNKSRNSILGTNGIFSGGDPELNIDRSVRKIWEPYVDIFFH